MQPGDDGDARSRATSATRPVGVAQPLTARQLTALLVSEVRALSIELYRLVVTVRV
jgi:hypothetical protein